jgi:hypothetical protein
MKYFHWFKGLVFIALACSVTAQGSTVDVPSSDNNPSKDKIATVNNLSISSGQDQNNKVSSNLVVSGETNLVVVAKEGTVKLSAGKSISLLPGTKISAGGFLYASIDQVSKNGKHRKKEIRLVTVEEKQKIEEQASFRIAYTLFSPFPSRNKGYLHAGDAENGSFKSLSGNLAAVSPEQQRKVAVDSRELPETTRRQFPINYNLAPEAIVYRAEVTRVLRL